ncbi:hypothetical protein QUB60_23150 [Microcoleus sp. A2-C5]|uniref:hypothetical protein n=1 Tax=Microcoleus sp. A2-C2 TaxID=2818530 RepID=UPI002FD21E7B
MRSPSGAQLKLQPISFGGLSCIVLVKINVVAVDRSSSASEILTHHKCKKVIRSMDQFKNGKFYS